jgi:hypothetical protein
MTDHQLGNDGGAGSEKPEGNYPHDLRGKHPKTPDPFPAIPTVCFASSSSMGGSVRFPASQSLSQRNPTGETKTSARSAAWVAVCLGTCQSMRSPLRRLYEELTPCERIVRGIELGTCRPATSQQGIVEDDCQGAMDIVERQPSCRNRETSGSSRPLIRPTRRLTCSTGSPARRYRSNPAPSRSCARSARRCQRPSAPKRRCQSRTAATRVACEDSRRRSACCQRVPRLSNTPRSCHEKVFKNFTLSSTAPLKTVPSRSFSNSPSAATVRLVTPAS